MSKFYLVFLSLSQLVPKFQDACIGAEEKEVSRLFLQLLYIAIDKEIYKDQRLFSLHYS